MRSILGQDVPGQGRVSVPQIFNRGPATGGPTEQSPLATIPDAGPSLPWQLYNAGVYNRGSGDPAIRQRIIERHNLNQDLLNDQLNAGRGLYTVANREAIGRWGDPTRGGGGTEQMNAGSNATRANADMVQARTGAATLEAATTPAAARERFMRNLPSGITPAQASQLADMEEARGAFSRPGLNMAAILGATPM
jgi:hypothetical protein